MSAEKLDVNVTVLRPGRFGTALLLPLSENVRQVTIYLEDSEAHRLFQETQENQKYFPEFKLPDNVRSTNNLKEALKSPDVVVYATPTKHLRAVCESAEPFIPSTPLL